MNKPNISKIFRQAMCHAEIKRHKVLRILSEKQKTGQRVRVITEDFTCDQLRLMQSYIDERFPELKSSVYSSSAAYGIDVYSKRIICTFCMTSKEWKKYLQNH